MSTNHSQVLNKTRSYRLGYNNVQRTEETNENVVKNASRLRLTAASGKAKGRLGQQFVAKALLSIGTKWGLVADDIKSVSIGVSGVDILLSPAAKKVFGQLAVEVKVVEKLNVVTVFHKHAAKYLGQFAILVHRKNRTETLVTLRLTDFLPIYAAAIEANQ